MSTFKEKILACEKLSGTHINLNDPCIASIVSALDYDYIWIDMEHSYLTFPNLLAHIVAIQNAGIPVIVRAPQHDFTATKKIMEMGPDGIIFPMVKSAAEAKELIDYTLYPPYGCRGYGPGHAVRFGIEDAGQFTKTNHKDMCRFIQIEHIDLVNELEEVIKNPYIDGYIFGPMDLSGSIGELGNVYDEPTQKLFDRCIKILKDNNKSIGFSIGGIWDDEIIKFWSEKGINFISCNSDFGMLARGMKITRELMKAHH